MTHPPAHHPPAHLLHDHALGCLDVAQAILVDTHLTLCPECRAQVASLTELGGTLLEEVAPAALSASFEQRLMARLEAAPPSACPSYDATGTIPAPLLPWIQRAVGRPVHHLEELPWSWRAPDLKAVDLLPPRDGRLPLRLLRFEAGSAVPHHDHEGDERAVVLHGGWTDHRGHVDRGDFAFTPAEVQGHLQQIDAAAPCIALVLNDRPIRARSWVVRAYARARML